LRKGAASQSTFLFFEFHTQNFADSRLRVKGRFVKKEDEELLREILNIT
jgi:hypothetical protein